MIKKSNQKRDNFILAVLIISVVLVIAGITILAVNGKKMTLEERLNYINDEQSAVLGIEDSKIVIVEFSDFQCPACRIRSKELDSLVSKYSDSIKFVYRHFPLTSIHKNAYKAAEASEAAGAQGLFWEMHDMLFENQEEWSDLSSDDLISKFIDYARIIRVNDLIKFENDLRNGAFAEKINSDIKDAEKLKINATPTIFLNGEKQSNPSFENLSAKIDELKNSQ